ncbi:MAG: AI-2E family transporter [Terriglobales bacterium]
MDFRSHFRITTGALGHWFRAATYDALAVGAIWLVGLAVIGVPWAPLWAVLGGLSQYIPHFGPVLALIGPAFAAVASGGFHRLLYVLILYAIIAAADGFVLQPLFMKRTARVPVWASILTPIVLGVFFSFWGVLISAPLLAIVFAYRGRHRPQPADRSHP